MVQRKDRMYLRAKLCPFHTSLSRWLACPSTKGVKNVDKIYLVPRPGMIVSGHVLISCTHTSKSVNKIAWVLRCMHSADQKLPLKIATCLVPFHIFNHISKSAKVVKNVESKKVNLNHISNRFCRNANEQAKLCSNSKVNRNLIILWRKHQVTHFVDREPCSKS